MKKSMLLVLVVSAAFGGCAAHAQRVGQSATVQFGTVRSAETVSLDSDAPKGALIGGTLGLVAGRGRHSARNGLIGAAIGGVATAAAQRNRTAIAYSVEMTDGSMTRIVTDQREIRTGDCVAVERVGQTANIRRESAHRCERGNEAARTEIREASVNAAVKCENAKQELVNATTNEAADLASRKIEVLCDR